MRDSGHVVVCKKGAQCPRGDARALLHAKAPRGTIVHKLATKIHVLWFAQAKLPDSLLRVHIPGLVLFVASYQMQDLANNSGTIKALLLNHSRRNAVEGPLSKERRSSDGGTRVSLNLPGFNSLCLTRRNSRKKKRSSNKMAAPEASVHPVRNRLCYHFFL